MTSILTAALCWSKEALPSTDPGSYACFMWACEPSTTQGLDQTLLEEAAIRQTSKECGCLQLFQELATQMSSIHFDTNLTLIQTSTLTNA